MARATIYIGADTAKANSALKSTSKSVAAFGKATINAGAKVAGGLLKMTAAFTAMAVVVGKKAVDAFIESENAQMRLVTISKQTLNATKEQIQAFNDQAKALSKVTTVEDDAITVGQSQLASFTRSAKVVEILTGDMLDLAVAQYGANVSGDQMQQTANMVGKALSGQLGAMTRAGVLVSDDLKKAFEAANTEEERAAVISEILASNYGGLAEAASKTAEGGLLQLKNRLSDMGEEIGAVIVPAIQEIVPKIDEMLPEILRGFKNIYGGIVAIMSGKESGGDQLASGISELVTPIIEGLAAALPQLVVAFTEIMVALVNSLIENKEPIFEAAKGLVETLGVALIQLIPEIITLGIELFTALLQSFASADIAGEITNAIVLIVDAIAQNLPAIVEAGLLIVIGLIEGIAEAQPQISAAIVEMIPLIVETIIENLPQLILAGGQLVGAIIIGLVANTPALITAIYEGVKSGIKSIAGQWPQIKEQGKQLIQNFVNGISSAWNDLKLWAGNIVNVVVDALGGLWSKAKEAGKNIIAGMINGLVSAATSLYLEVKRIATEVINKFKKIFEERSPSRVMFRIGEYIMEGWANGMLSARGLLENAMGQSINSLGRPLLASGSGGTVNNYSSSTYAPQTNMNVNSLLTDKGALLQLSRLLDNAKALENARRGMGT